MNIAWFNCANGIAGDMALASLVDAGAPLYEIMLQLQQLDVPDWTITSERVDRCGIACTYLNIQTSDIATSRNYSEIRSLVAGSPIADRTKQRALNIFERLAIAEAKVHDTEIDEVHFHEVGGVDAIIDIVGTCIALELLDIENICASSVACGMGHVSSAHGTMPNPPPAVVELLKGVPAHGMNIDKELTTPTGAAIVSALATHFGEMPQMASIDATGYGAGSRNHPAVANCTQVIIGTASEAVVDATTVIETNVDDATGEVLARTVAALMDTGAYDAWVTPIVMKKGRPAHTVSALCARSKKDSIAQIMMRETGSFGVRGYTVQRNPLARKMHEVDVDGHTVALKSSRYRSKAEFEDAVAAAEATGRPVRTIISEAEAKARP